MDADIATVSAALERQYLLNHPGNAALQVERLPLDDVMPTLTTQPAEVLRPIMEHLATDVGAQIIARLPRDTAATLMGSLHPGIAAGLLGQMDKAPRRDLLKYVSADVRQELERFMSYPPGSVARIMDTRFVVLRSGMTAENAITRLRQSDISGQRAFIVVDDDNRVTSRVNVEDLVVATAQTLVDSFAKPLKNALDLQSTEEELAEIVRTTGMATLPVVGADRRLVGIVRPRASIRAVEETASASVQTMVGASASEHGLSPPLFAVRKRIGWLTINLATAFLAAAVVGFFEDTIAAYTALAVLLPVVAGQSGNAGAQALAVTMRALTLREIGVRMWMPVLGKELTVGLLNGLAIAAICSIAVFLWSQSLGLMLIIAAAMITSMIIAGIAGALVPISLIRMGQDPAASSSIILTTITDLAGFFSFLGIATVLAFMI